MSLWTIEKIMIKVGGVSYEEKAYVKFVIFSNSL